MSKTMNSSLRVIALLSFLVGSIAMQGQIGEVASWTAAGHGYSSGYHPTTIVIAPNYVEGEFDVNTGSSAPAFYPTSGFDAIRLYANNTFSVTPINGTTISRVEYTFLKTSKAYAAIVPPTMGNYASGGIPTTSSPVTDIWTCPENEPTDKAIVITLGPAGQRALLQVSVTYNENAGQTHTLTYHPNWPNTLGTGQMEPESYVNGATVTVATSGYTCYNHLFDRWNTAPDGSGTDYYPGSTFHIYSSLTLYAQWIDLSNGLVDVINPDNVNASIPEGQSTYCEWSVTCLTGIFPNIYETTYKGKSFPSDNFIQINSTTSTAPGIVTTISHGLAQKVEIIWDENTSTGRTLNVYGKNVPYNNTSDLYDINQGTLIGTITKEAGSHSGALVINDSNIHLGDYAFIGLRSAQNVMYLDEIRITWTAETQPVVLFTPTSIDMGNMVVDNEVSTTFIVNQSNLEYDINLTVDKGNLEPEIIARNADPTQVTWTYTPESSDIGSFSATVTATSGQFGETGYCSNTLPINGLVLDNTGTSLTVAKRAYLNQGSTSALINLAGDGSQGSQVEVVGQYGNRLYLQDGASGLLVYGSNAPAFEVGSKFTAGSLTGTFTTYQNSIIELVDFSFQDVEYSTGNTLTSVPTTLSELLTDTIHQYEYRYVQITDSVHINSIDPIHWQLGIDNDHVLAMTDLLGTTFNTKTAPDVEDQFAVKGLFNRFYSSGDVQVELAPTTLSDIITCKKAAAPTFDPVGGPTEANAVQTTAITVTPATNTTLNYAINGDEFIQNNNEIVININGLTTISSFASRDFYTNSTALTYYYKLPDQTYSVHFSINGTVEESYTVIVSGELLKGQCPSVENIGQFILRGWSTSPSSTEVVTLPMNGINSDLILYAVYTLPSSYDYIQLTDHINIEAGEYVILSDDGRGRYYTLKNAVSYSSPLAFLINDLELSIENNQLVGDDFSEVTWTITGDNPTAYTINSTSNPDLYLYTTNNSTGVRIGNTPATWTLTEDAYINGLFNLESNTYNRYLTLFVNDNYNTVDWRCYTSSNMYNNNSHPRLTLFRKTPLFLDTDPCYTRIFVNETATTEINIDGPSVIPSAAHLNTSDGSYLKMGNYPITSTEAEWLLIENGASFTPAANNTSDIKATVQVDIAGYGYDDNVLNGWYLISSPVGMVNANGVQQAGGSIVEGLTTGTAASFDLYTFDQSQTNGEWQNFEANGNSLTFGLGESILYASQYDRTITFKGTLSNTCTEQPLVYSEGAAFAGWNLIGNPFTHNAYFDSDNISDFYKLVETNNSGVITSELQPVQANENTVNPMEGIFVKVNDSEQTFSFSNYIRQQNTLEGMINIKAISSNGSIIDQARIRFNNGFPLEKYMLNPSNTRIYIPQDGKNYAVVNIKEGNETPINFDAAKNGTYTLLIEVSDVEMEYLHLIDNLTAADVDLLQEPSYTFESKTIDYSSRFRLLYKASGTTPVNDTNESFAYFDGSNWIVSNEGESSLLIIDVLGRTVRTESINGNTILNLDKLSRGFYIMYLINGSESRAQKIVIK